MTTTAQGLGSLDAAAVAEALGAGDCGEVAGDAGRRAQYASDASNYRQIPLAVVFPAERRHIQNALAVCRRLGVPVTARGAGTSTSGQAVGPGVVLDFSRHFHRLLALDPKARTATVEPGIVLDELQQAAAPHGLLFGADPSTHSRCTLGGMIGNNACGSHSLAWGRTADNIVELDVVTYRGTVIRLGEMTAEEIDEAIAAGDDRGELIAALHRLTQRHLATLRTELGRFPRQVSGYALEQLLPERRFNLARALVGSEGTLAVILSATVRLVSPPPARALVVLGFSDACAAADAVPALLAHQPLALEGLDHALTDIVTRPATRAAIDTLPDARAWLFAELGGSAEALPRQAEALTEAAHRAAGCTGSEVITDPVRARTLWRIREDGAGLATRMPDGSEAWPGWEDAAVPPEQLGSYLRKFTELLEQHGLQGAVYGHFGEGCLHVRINFDFGTEQGTAVFRAFVTDAARLITAHGGSLSGEHGDGQARSELLPLMYGPEVIALFEEFKGIWDPDNGLNPGMIVQPLPVDGNLRVSPHRTPLPLATVFPFHADDGDFAKATRRCVGVGKCRSADQRGDVMCPSYRVTRDEKDSTRGRARLLYEMTQGEVITDGWRSTEVRDALDLCLSCKGCSTDCPVGVDMATYKSEFLHHHYKGRLRPASHYTMGWLPLLSRLASRAPGLVNAVTSSRLAPAVKRLGGIAAQRELPRFAEQTFLTWFRRRTPQGDGLRGPVVLWVDSFNNHFSPEVLKAGVAVLEDAGFRVQVPDGTQCCGLTWITTGQLGTARRIARRTAAALAPAVTAGLPVVGLEPSCTAALKSDLPELLDGDQDARALSRATLTLAELLVHHAPGWQPPRIDARSLSQTHCHQHATSGFGADSALLERMGVDNTALDSGCCGLAGNFGFERGHYEVSVAAGEQVLLPAVRSAPADTRILADGFSCRTQIAQQTSRGGTHLAQLIAQALPPADPPPDPASLRFLPRRNTPVTDALSLIDEWGPEKTVVVSHRRTGMKGVLVIDNTARGIGKGGTRMSPGVTVEEVSRLARVMTWKWAAVDLFYGGAKAGIVADPASRDKEAVLRAFARALSNEVPREYVMGLDMGLTESDAAIIQDELGDRGAAVGTPEHLGGVAYDKLGVTGYGVAEAAEAAAQHQGLPLAGSRVALQGFGAVGSAAATRFAELGATIVAVSTAHGVLHDPSGLDVGALLSARDEHGDHFVTRHPAGIALPSGAELTVDCDILVPAALQDVITGDTAHQIKAKLIVEGANLPTSADARTILAGRGITVLPDFVANAGGVVAAAFAMDARYSGFRPGTASIFESVSARLRANAVTVLDEARQQDITPHAAGRRLAEDRVRAAMRSKGRIPLG